MKLGKSQIILLQVSDKHFYLFIQFRKISNLFYQKIINKVKSNRSYLAYISFKKNMK